MKVKNHFFKSIKQKRDKTPPIYPNFKYFFLKKLSLTILTNILKRRPIVIYFSKKKTYLYLF